MIHRILLGLLLLMIVGAGGFYLYLRSSLPQIEGRIAVERLTGPVTIARDAEGVPLISAGSDADAAFGLGYAHAQDRLFQMETMRRYGAGRLAEVMGQEMVKLDRQMRVLGLYRAAEAQLALLSPEMRHDLDAYTAGVNAFLATRHGALPPEFLVLRFSPEPWRPADSMVWAKVMDLDLAGNYRGELVRAKLARNLSPEQLAFLYPEYPKAAPTTLAALSKIYRRLPLDTLEAALPRLPMAGPLHASNNWVVDGAHTAGGKPVLANDPHLGFAAPGIWYLARLKTPQREIAGATAPGVPLVIIGHNDRIAWGFTTTGGDVADLFIEKIDPADPGRYLTPEGAAAFATRQETVAVRGADPVTFTVRSTRHGPVLSDILPPDSVETGYVLALQATWLTGDDRTAEALWDINRAADWSGFRNAAGKYVAPQQNMVYADTAGTIGFIAPARIPIRKTGDGWLPMPGWTGEYDWTGFVPFAELPQALNPASGHFVSANNKIVPDGYRHFLTRDWDMPNRAERIEEMLAATPRQSAPASLAMQADTVSIAARRLVPLMTRIVPDDDASREAIERLQAWDFRMDADKVEPLLFTAWLRAFARAVFYGKLGAAAGDYWDLRPRVIEAVLTGDGEWCAGSNDQAAKEPEGPARCAALLATTLDDTLATLRRAYGQEIAQWQWGRAHVAEFAHPVFSRVPMLRDWLRLGIPTDGGFDTVNRGPTTIRDDANPYAQRYGAGLRMVTDLASPADSLMIATPGQSGNPFSPHFSDLLQRWREFRYLVPGRAEAVATLTLEPAR